MQQAATHCDAGIGIWTWAGTEDAGQEPDVVMACAGDVPTLETLAAVDFLRRQFPELRIRVVNVVDLMRLQTAGEHPHGMPDADFDAIFTTDRPIIFAFHGYPWLIHRLSYRRRGHAGLHVRGFIERGTTTTPFDMVMLNDLDRFHLVMDVIDRVPGLAATHGALRQELADARTRARAATREAGQDAEWVREWRWPESALPVKR
jgi:xylulose-5-phosphate/fructose-6-phosphate phosphoketolase